MSVRGGVVLCMGLCVCCVRMWCTGSYFVCVCVCVYGVCECVFLCVPEKVRDG